MKSMSQLEEVPAAVWAASLVLVVGLAQTVVGGHLGLASLPAMLLLVTLLLLGSRVVWTLWVGSAIWDVVARLDGVPPSWRLGLDAVVLAALLHPSSLRFFWTNRPVRRFPAMDRISRLPYGLIAWRLGFALIPLFWLSGMAARWEEDNRDSSALAALADATYIVVSIALLGFGVSLCVWLYGSLRARSRRRLDEESGSALGE